MGHKYNKFYQQPKKSENSENKMEEVFDEVIEDIVVDSAAVLTNEEVEQLTEEDVINVEVNDEGLTATGVVVNCTKLNVRKEADKNSEVLCVINNGEEVTVDLEVKGQPVPSDVSFYQVITSSGVKGYCMTNYIELK